MAGPCLIRLYTVRIDVGCRKRKQSQLATYWVDGMSDRVYFSTRETVSPNNLTHLHKFTERRFRFYRLTLLIMSGIHYVKTQDNTEMCLIKILRQKCFSRINLVWHHGCPGSCEMKHDWEVRQHVKERILCYYEHCATYNLPLFWREIFQI